jgi:hypothetical protein
VTDVVPGSAQAAEVDRWCALLDQLCMAWTSTAMQGRTMPPSTSPAFREDALLATNPRRWDAHDASNAGRDALALTALAVEQLHTLRTVAMDRPLVLTLSPPARHVAEYISQAGWLLDPGIKVDERIARRLLLRLAGLHRYRQTLVSMDVSEADLKAVKSAREEAKEQVLCRFPDAGELGWSLGDHPEGPPWEVAGQRVPTLGGMVRHFAKVHGLQQARGVYDMLSLQSHPNLVVAASAIETVRHEDFVQFVCRIDLPQAARVLRLAALMFYRVAMAVTSYFEWDPAELNAWHDSLPG